MGEDDFGSNFDLGSFDDLAAVDALNFSDLGLDDLRGYEDLDLGDIAAIQDLGALDIGNIDISGLGLEGLSSYEDLNLGDQAAIDSMLGTSGQSTENLSRSLSLGPSEGQGGLGFKATGRGQLSQVDPTTGATGLTAEGFRNIQDLLGSGTAEEIARYTPGTVDYSLRSGIDTEGGQGLSADATRGMGLSSMGGGQGISKYIPAQYGDSVLADLVKNNPDQTGAIQDYLNNEIYGGKGLDPYAGSGGTLSQAGFLEQSSAANPLGAKYSIGDPNSFINRPSITGQQATVSPGRTVINNGDGTYKVVTNNGNGTLTTKTVTADGKVVNTNTNTSTNTKTNTITNTGAGSSSKSGLDALLPLLLALLAMNRGGGSSGSSAVIPALTATQRQTPYTQIQQSAGYRPGQGGITYFNPTEYTQKMAGGGIAGLNGGRLLQGPGDGVSDSIPAVISGMAGGGQPARLARGEYVMDARTVAALGNGSTDAGAERLDQMRRRILADDRKAGVGKDSKAYRHLA